MRKAQKKERGQAIVLIAISFLALIAFTGLAIDGGRIYADRRHAQNASDAGSLAGGGEVALALENADIDHLNFECPPRNLDGTYANGTNAYETIVKNAMDAAVVAAEDQMEENGYVQDEFSVEPFCFEGSTTFHQYIDITTTITRETSASFIQVVYDGPLTNLVDATTEVKPRHPYAYGNAIVALNPNGPCTNASAGGIKFGGTGEVIIRGGGAWSDGCLVTQGNCNVTIEGGPGISFVDDNFGSCPIMDPPPVDVDERLDPESYIVEPPECTDADRIDSITVNNNQTLDLNPGYPDPNDPTAPPNTTPAKLICVTDTGNAIKMNGGTLIGHGVTIYMENGGDITINGGVVNLSSPVENDVLNGAIPGVIFYTSAASNIDIEGNHESSYTGMIYGPLADIKITGEGDIGPTLNTQIIGYNVTLLGTASIRINFNESWIKVFPTSLDLIE